MQENQTTEQRHLSSHHHMRIQWKEFFKSPDDTPLKNITLVEKGSLVGRIGLMLLSCGTGAWRVRDSMNIIARALKITCSADIGLVSINYTCFDVNNKSYSQTLSLPTTAVNMNKLNQLENLVRQFETGQKEWTIGEIHQTLDQINHHSLNYSTITTALCAGIACCCFIFLLGGGLPEMCCSFLGALIGNYVHGLMGKKKITLIAKIAVAVAISCGVYFLCFLIGQKLLGWHHDHVYGYIGAMLYVIPGFPFITSGLDLSKLDMRSGLERLTYAILIIMIATMVGWGAALSLNLTPGSMPQLHLNFLLLTCFRLLASFGGVFGFSIMFNSSLPMAIVAALIGALANTLRLSLVDLTHLPAALAAFIGALLAGLIASFVRDKVGFPRIAITVPAIVIMVPGLYMYRAAFDFGVTQINVGAYWIMNALMIIIALPMGLLTARILTDAKWRHAD
ncbi:threonine/serine exporter family protein [Lactobacillus sp. ESL0684]|uniref:threonine/serine ThrE exporter family protein n=1 Tax=unclassified Lactobacillus TaxID=2620435 RepID=UPI0023F873D1|nr:MULTISPECIES: threonine/serine exporter family protein [unclassified Lactobacillus]WEV39543.1 threonine/serine exporter family protein [Lactobacillus sp. ESL0681]WEV43941.1 threonine/serine exporter family protein [Lactobacillus sp. ESL0684]